MIKIYTDGACSGNPGKGGWAATIHDQSPARLISGEEAFTTNNRMELKAVLEALKGVPTGAPVQINTDSQNVIGWLSKGWKRKVLEVRELCEEIERVVANNALSVTFEWVRGHATNADNNLVDKIATQISQGRPLK
jgi:ribonuclease HI